MKTKCAHCNKKLLNPFFMFNHPYCNKQCFHDHMSLISDRNIIQRFHREGTTNLREKQIRSMVRLKLLNYDYTTKKHTLTPRAQKILNETPVQQTHPIPQAHLARL